MNRCCVLLTVMVGSWLCRPGSAQTPVGRSGTVLPSLPEPRSSHDVVVIGSKIIVTGGWAIRGSRSDWAETLAIPDVSAKNPDWTSRLHTSCPRTQPPGAAQPFKRRALMASTSSDGPKLPNGPGLSFAPAAGMHNGELYVSVSDGTLYQLNRSSNEWEPVRKSTPRLAHRIAFAGDAVLIIGGADQGKNSDLVGAAVPVRPGQK